jgi:UDP-N-acetylglucosamine--N-acetylmuramyl-(pentapeptide) pyrophosphoryl-undecaprenol N-acetylglucosamine transferase
MKILAVAGSSGGHIYPAMSLLSAVRNRIESAQTLLVVPRRSISRTIIPDTAMVEYICTTQLSLKPSFRNLIAGFVYLKGVAQSLELILRFRPDVVIGFGSIDSIPLVMFAWLFRIHTVIHEQNVVPGRANSFLARFADRIAVSFSRTETLFDVNPAKIIFTGNPVRPDLVKLDKKKALEFFGLSDNRLTILAMGGSQGSSRINKYFSEAVRNIKDVQVIHISGANDCYRLEEYYKKAQIEARVIPFCRDMHYAYSASDMAVCRAGATTIAELSYFALPAVIIPYPFAYDHQIENARLLEGAGAAEVIRDCDLESGVLEEEVRKCSQRKFLDHMRVNYGGYDRPAAAELLADLVSNVK